MPRSCLAVDIGGSKLEVGLVDREGSILRSQRRPTPDLPAEELWDAVAQVVRDVTGGPRRARRGALRVGPERVEVCGVGCGGPMSPGGEEVSPLNIPAWRAFPLRARLAELTGLPVAVDNDAKALALGEGWLGAARGLDDFLAMVVSTGVGGGIVLDGRLLDGRLGNAGHIGHLVVVPEGRACACGGQGCLEAEASGLAIAALTGAPAEQAGPEMIERTGTLVGRAVASVANLLDLRLAVVAGSVALGFGGPFFEAAQREVDRRARLDFSAGTRIVPAGLGARGPLLGAAAVGWRAVASRAAGSRALGTPSDEGHDE